MPNLPAQPQTGSQEPAKPFVERRRRNRSAGFPLHISILSAFATLFAVSILVLVSFAFYKNSGSMLDLTQRFVARVAISGTDRTVALLDPVGDNVVSLARLSTLDEAKSRDGSLFPYLESLLQGSPQLQSVYLAFDKDGRFLQSFPIPPGTEKFGAHDEPPPPGARFARRVVDRSHGYSDVWTYVDAQGREVGRESSDELNYDARPRPWYKDAVAAGGLVWSDLLVYTSNRQPGITAAHPIRAADGRLIGVAAANVATQQLSSFLAAFDLGKSGVALLVDEKEQLIAYPDPSRTVRVEGLKASLVKVDELGNRTVSDAFAAYRAHPAAQIHFQSDGKPFMGSFTVLPNSFGKKWLLVILVLEDDFVGELRHNNTAIVGLGLALTIVGMLGIGILSRWITTPIRKVVHEIGKIQKFDLVGPIAVHARIREVNELIHALNVMKRAVRTFAMFVPTELVRDMMASGRPIELGGQGRELTVMFTDIASFTSLSERMTPDALLIHVSRHLEAMSHCILEESGTVDKYIGDAVMAFWGAPLPRRDHALRACVAALKAQAVQARLNREWADQGLPTMRVRMGLHTATVIVGNIGSVQRMSYTVVGDGVNVASRLEGVNKVYGTNVCVSEAVLAQAGPTVLARPLDRVAVKGRQAGELVYELVALTEGPPELLATPAQLEICRLTEDAFAAYQNRDWDGAMALYARLAELAPDDALPALFTERCRHNKAAPPPADWSGVFEMTTK